MSVVDTIHPFDNANVHHTNLASIGAQRSYFFYQQLNSNPPNNLQPKKPKQIIPSIPRKHFKTLKNSSLSPIRSQKVMPKQIILKRPYALVATFSSPASLQTTTTPTTTTTTTTTTTKKRQRKVSFDEKVVVVCTIFDEDDADLDQQKPPPTEVQRHSHTGETQPKSILVVPPPPSHYTTTTSSLSLTLLPPLTRKISRSLKQFKNRLLFV